MSHQDEKPPLALSSGHLASDSGPLASLLGIVRDAFSTYRDLFVPLAIFLLETSFIFQVPSVSFTDLAGMDDRAFVAALLAAVASTIVCGAGAFAAKRFHLDLTTRPFWYGASIVTTVGWLICLADVFVETENDWVRDVGLVVTGAGSALWLPALTLRLAEAGPRRTMVFVLLSYLVVMPAGLVITTLSPLFVLTLNALACVAMLWFYPVGQHRRGGVLQATPTAGGSSNEFVFPLKLATTYLFLGLASGIVGGIVGSGSVGISGFLEVAVIMTFTGILVVVLVFKLKLDFNRLIYQIGLPLLAFAFALMLTFAPEWTVATIIQESANLFLEILTWGVVSYLVLYRRISPSWIALCPTAALYAGQCAGLCAGHFSITSPDVTFWFPALASLLSFSIMLAAMWLLGYNSESQGWGAVRPADVKEEYSPETAVCKRLALDNGLTPRETEILMMLARGRTKRHIAGKLVITEDTAKTHILRVYRKLGIHSQQELLDLVDAGVEDSNSGRMRP